MEEEEGGENTTPFWVQSSSSTTRRRRLRPSSSVFLNSGVLLFTLCIAAALFVFLIIPHLISLTPQILKPPNLVKKSWDSINIVLVLFALMFGFLSRNINHDNSNINNNNNNNNNNSNNNVDLIPDIEGESTVTTGWYHQYSDRTAVSGLKRTHSSYPDLRQIYPPDEVEPRDTWRFSDDMSLDGYRKQEGSNEDTTSWDAKGVVSGTITPPAQPHSQPLDEDRSSVVAVEESEMEQMKELVKALPVPPAVSRRTRREPNEALPQPPAVSRRTRRQPKSTEIGNEEEHVVENEVPPQPPAVSRRTRRASRNTEIGDEVLPQPTAVSRRTKRESKSMGSGNEVHDALTGQLSSATETEQSNEAAVYAALLLQTAFEKSGLGNEDGKTPHRKTKRAHNRSLEELNYDYVSNEIRASEIVQDRPFLSSPSPEKKRERKRAGNVTKDFLASLRKRKKKQRNKSVENLESQVELESEPPPPLHPAAPPSPPPPSTIQNFFSSKKGKSKRIITVPPPPPPPPPYSNSAAAVRRPPLPAKVRIYDEASNSGGDDSPMATGYDSPLHPIPAPPPPPPFKMPGWKFVVKGDYVSIGSMNSSRSVSPEPDEVESSSESGGTPSAADMAGGNMFCPSPDVNSKADMFIAKFRAGLKLQKANSMKQKQGGVGLSNLGPSSKPDSGSRFS